MMDLLLATSGGESQSASGGYVDDVFSAYTYTGNGSTQTINNGIDLAGEGGMVWIKSRSYTISHALFDTIRGVQNRIESNKIDFAQTFSYGLSSFSSSGFSVNDIADGRWGVNGSPGGTYAGSDAAYISWTFRRAPKFFDVVTYTGNGTSNRQIAHSLGVQAGFVTVKATSTTGDWNSYHRSATGDLKLNLTDAQAANRAIITAADANTFTVSGAANTNGVSYVAYLFAHDPSADGIIQCGSYAGNGSTAGPVVTLGWESQYLMIKNASGTGNWQIIDSMRGMPVGPADATLQANLSNAESATDYVSPTATGFQVTSTSSEVNTSGSTYIYLAIRRPNKPPTSGTQVYNASTASGVVSAGFPVDLHIGATRTGAASNHAMHTRLTGGTKELVTSSTAVEATITGLGFDSMTGLRASLPAGGVNHFFRRAQGFMDVVCYSQITGGNVTVSHSLGVAPELIITKERDGTRAWDIYHKDWPNHYLRLNEVAVPYSGTNFDNLSATQFRQFATNAKTYVAYLFASLPGISKVGSYTGNGSSQTIDCGFSTGARFVLIKRTDATGDWYVWDTARGIVAANDPHLSLNTIAAEVTTDDSIDPASVGFIVNQNATTNVNVNGGQYIFLAIA